MKILILFLFIFLSCGDDAEYNHQKECKENEILIENRCSCNGYICEDFQECTYDDEILLCKLKENACFTERNCKQNQLCINNFCEDK